MEGVHNAQSRARTAGLRMGCRVVKANMGVLGVETAGFRFTSRKLVRSVKQSAWECALCGMVASMGGGAFGEFARERVFAVIEREQRWYFGTLPIRELLISLPCGISPLT